MTPVILSIAHNVLNFKIEKEPEDFNKEGLKLIGTILRRHMPELKESVIYQNHYAIKYEVNLTAKQVFNRESDLCEINLQSTFIFLKTEEEPKDDFWCSLMSKALEGLMYSYDLETTGTYLKNTELGITKTMKEDCLKQRHVDRVMLKN